MAKLGEKNVKVILHNNTTGKRTSIGNSHNSRPNNKHKRRCWKKYRGQGR
jgi:hypothetical protein